MAPYFSFYLILQKSLLGWQGDIHRLAGVLKDKTIKRPVFAESQALSLT